MLPANRVTSGTGLNARALLRLWFCIVTIGIDSAPLRVRLRIVVATAQVCANDHRVVSSILTPSLVLLYGRVQNLPWALLTIL
jgi:hypothetical protein